MTCSTTQFPVTIVSTDTTALRELSWTLSSFGYQVETSSDWSENAFWRQVDSPSLIMLDARDETEIQDVLNLPHNGPFVYRIAFYDETCVANSGRLLEMGADDLIRFPLNIGELLSRVKSGGRRLEFERRLSSTVRSGNQSRITSRKSLIRQLERRLRNNNEPTDGALVVVGIDALERLRAKHGNIAAAEASSQLARCLSDELTTEDYCGLLTEGVFGALLLGCSVGDGVEFAEALSDKFKKQFASAHTERTRYSVSAVILNWPSGDSASQAVQRGITNLEQLFAFGGNLILDANEVDQIHSNWKQKFPPYHEVFAHHVMEALPLVLPINGQDNDEGDRLGIYAFAASQTLPPCIPVVDDDGCMLGVIESETLRNSGNDALDSIEEHLVPVEQTIKRDLRLDEIIGTMSSAQKEYLVVVEENKPIGYLTYENIVAMAVDPIGESADDEPELVGTGMNSLVIPLSH